MNEVAKLREMIIEFWTNCETEILMDQAKTWIFTDPVCDILEDQYNKAVPVYKDL